MEKVEQAAVFQFSEIIDAAALMQVLTLTIKRQTTATAVNDHIIGGGLAAALGFLTTAYCVTREVWRCVRARNGYYNTSQTSSNGGPLTRYTTVFINDGGGGGLEATARVLCGAMYETTADPGGSLVTCSDEVRHCRLPGAQH